MNLANRITTRRRRIPRLLFVAPEALFLPYRDSPHIFVGHESGRANQYLTYLISDLYHSGADVHVVQPRYRRVFAENCPSIPQGTCSHLPADRVHLAQDRFFFYIGQPHENHPADNIRLSITFLREVINRWIPELAPELIHCHDWMGGLIPAACRPLGIATLFCIGDLHTVRIPLSLIEEIGVDAAAFWDRLYYGRMPLSYEETRCSNLIDPLISGIWSASCVHTIGAAVAELAASIGGSDMTPLRQMLRIKYRTARLACNPAPEAIYTQHQIELIEQILKRPLLQAQG
jgi:starch synthase